MKHGKPLQGLWSEKTKIKTGCRHTAMPVMVKDWVKSKGLTVMVNICPLAHCE